MIALVTWFTLLLVLAVALVGALVVMGGTRLGRRG